MTKGAIATGALVVAFVGAIALAYLVITEVLDPAGSPSTAITPDVAAAKAHPSFLYGRITTDSGTTYEGRLRWGRDEEAFWGDYFDGVKTENSWAAYLSPEQLSTEPRPVEIFGMEVTKMREPIDLRRLFLARFGDIARIERVRRDVRVTLKSGTVTRLDYNEANDFGDGVRVWDRTRGVVDLDASQIESIDILPAADSGPAPHRLHGTVRTPQGDFTGFIQWDRNKGLGTDVLSGRAADGKLNVRFDTIRFIAHHSGDTSLVTLMDGRELVLSGSREAGEGNLGIYVDDQRYGRVLISWGAFERLEFDESGSGPAYTDFPPGHKLSGSVSTLDGRHLTGRLIYDLDESETTETFDVSSQGVTYHIPFSMIASIILARSEARAKVMLHNGETLQVERTGDLGERTAGMLIFADGSPHPEYVLWKDVEAIEFSRPDRN